MSNASAEGVFNKSFALATSDVDCEEVLGFFRCEILSQPESIRDQIIELWLDYLRQPITLLAPYSDSQRMLAWYALQLVILADYKLAEPIIWQRLGEDLFCESYQLITSGVATEDMLNFFRKKVLIEADAVIKIFVELWMNYLTCPPSEDDDYSELEDLEIYALSLIQEIRYKPALPLILRRIQEYEEGYAVLWETSLVKLFLYRTLQFIGGREVYEFFQERLKTETDIFVVKEIMENFIGHFAVKGEIYEFYPAEYHTVLPLEGENDECD